MSTVQGRSQGGGLRVPKLKLHFWFLFSLTPLNKCFIPKAVVSWYVPEEQLVSPGDLQDVLLTQIWCESQKRPDRWSLFKDLKDHNDHTPLPGFIFTLGWCLRPLESRGLSR